MHRTVGYGCMATRYFTPPRGPVQEESGSVSLSRDLPEGVSDRAWVLFDGPNISVDQKTSEFGGRLLVVIAAGFAVRLYLGQPEENRHAVAHLAADRGGEAANLAADPYATPSSGRTEVPGRALSA